MQIQRIDSNNTHFGTRFGPKLARLLENNSEVLTSDNRRILSNIRNNGINSVLELEDATLHDKKMYNYRYVLKLHSPTIDRKNEIMNWKDTLYTNFQDYITGRISGNVIAKNDRFPIPVKDLKENTDILVLQKFNDKFCIHDRIEKEVKESETIVKEFEKFKKNFIEKLGRK